MDPATAEKRRQVLGFLPTAFGAASVFKHRIALSTNTCVDLLRAAGMETFPFPLDAGATLAARDRVAAAVLAKGEAAMIERILERFGPGGSVADSLLVAFDDAHRRPLDCIRIDVTEDGYTNLDAPTAEH